MRFQAARRAFTRRVQTLDRDLLAVLDDDVEALHRTRVASRRLREALPVMGADGEAGGHEFTKSRAAVRRLTRALGGVRELDVALGLLDELTERHPDLAEVAGAAKAAVEGERMARRGQMARLLADIKPSRLTRRLSLLAESVGDTVEPDRVARLRVRLLRRVARLEEAVESAGALYAFDRLHLVRIAAKKLRYLLELVEELGGVATRRLVNRLRRCQDLLGRLHDLEVVAAYVRRLARVGTRGRAADSRRLLDLIERETRELHAVYLGRTQALGDVVARCRVEVARRLATAGAPRATTR